MRLPHTVSLLTLSTVVLALVVGCDDPNAPPPPGAIRVAVVASGEDVSVQGLRVTVGDQASRELDPGRLDLTIRGLPPGIHSVRLDGLAVNCHVPNANPRSVTVVSNDTTTAEFNMFCTARVGSVRVTTATTGVDVDPDGYTAMVIGGPSQPIPVNGTAAIANVREGSRMVTLGGVSPNCAIAAADTVAVTVQLGAIVDVAFSLQCEPAEMRIETLLTDLHYPTGLWIRGGSVYFTETAATNTSYGGNLRLSRYELSTNRLVELIGQPENWQALVVDAAGRILLASYVGTIPGQRGAVSAAELTGGAWVETHLLDVAIAASNMFLDANGDVYLIGSSDRPDASSLYRLPSANYAAGATVIATGLGRATAVTKVGSDIYYAKTAGGGIRRIRGGVDNQLVPTISAHSLTSDGTYLYYAEALAGSISRLHLTSGAVETIATNLAQPINLRYDAGSRRIYFVESGTNEAEFKNGTLRVIINLP